MRKLLNTLYITTDDAYLTEESDSVVISQGSTKLGQFPLIAIENIMLFSFKGASPALLGKCAEKGIGVSQYTPNGKFLYRISDKNRGNVLLRKEQYRISDDGSRAMPYARNMILAKVYNQRNTVNRALRDHSMRIDKEKFTKVSNNLKKKMSDIENVSDIDALRGIEGDAAVDYFSVFDDMILNQKEAFAFNGRNRRPPLDNVNAMLSFLYTLLANDCADALEGVGLDSYVGFMHTDKPGRKSLALDLMEELRTSLVDRLVLTYLSRATRASMACMISSVVSMPTSDVSNTFSSSSSTSSSTFDLPATARASFSNSPFLVFSRPLSRVSRVSFFENIFEKNDAISFGFLVCG